MMTYNTGEDRITVTGSAKVEEQPDSTRITVQIDNVCEKQKEAVSKLEKLNYLRVGIKIT